MQHPEDLFFRALGDATRRRLLFLLLCAGELCVCELTAALGQSQPKISRHLAHLRAAGLVSDRRRGQWIFYRLRPDLPSGARDVLAAAARHVRTAPPYADDAAALAAIPGRRTGGPCGAASGTATSRQEEIRR